MWSGSGAPGKSTTSSGKRESRLTEIFYSSLLLATGFWLLAKEPPLSNNSHLLPAELPLPEASSQQPEAKAKIHSDYETPKQSGCHYRRFHGHWRGDREAVPCGGCEPGLLRARSCPPAARARAHRRPRQL